MASAKVVVTGLLLVAASLLSLGAMLVADGAWIPVFGVSGIVAVVTVWTSAASSPRGVARRAMGVGGILAVIAALLVIGDTLMLAQMNADIDGRGGVPTGLKALRQLPFGLVLFELAVSGVVAFGCALAVAFAAREYVTTNAARGERLLLLAGVLSPIAFEVVVAWLDGGVAEPLAGLLSGAWLVVALRDRRSRVRERDAVMGAAAGTAPTTS